jgi:hypothetical protein
MSLNVVFQKKKKKRRFSCSCSDTCSSHDSDLLGDVTWFPFHPFNEVNFVTRLFRFDLTLFSVTHQRFYLKSPNMKFYENPFSGSVTFGRTDRRTQWTNFL